jgi:hypothetical protein
MILIFYDVYANSFVIVSRVFENTYMGCIDMEHIVGIEDIVDMDYTMAEW